MGYSAQAVRIEGEVLAMVSRRAPKPRWRLFLACVLCVAVLLFWRYHTAFSKNDTSSASTVAISAQSPLADAKLAWPNAGGAAIGSVADGLLARSSNDEQLRPTASMAKVIAALAILQKQPLDSDQGGPTYTITARDVADYQAYVSKGGSVLPVYQGMRLTEYQALQAMLLPSANNIADMLTERVFGSASAYQAYAQNMLHKMGLNRTIVADASGFSSSTVSTPSEMVMIGIAALKIPVIAEIVAEPQAQLPGAGTVTNTNKLLGIDGVVGIKTGTTDSAGNCLLFAANYTATDGHQETIVGVIMGDTDSASLYADSQTLLVSVRQSLGLVASQPSANAAVTPSPEQRQSLFSRDQ